MFKEACRHREATVPSYDLMTVVPVSLTANDVAAILTQTRIAKTKKLRPRLEAMAAEEATIDLDINDWSSVMLALCGPDREHAVGPQAVASDCDENCQPTGRGVRN